MERLKNFLRRLVHSTAGQAARQIVAGQRLVLIIEQTGWDGRSLLAGLQQAGYTAHIVGKAGALLAVQNESPALLIVGGAPDADLYRALRHASPASILALIPHGDEEQVLAAFAAGVDQCQTGYLSHVETVARVRALLRRSA